MDLCVGEGLPELPSKLKHLASGPLRHFQEPSQDFRLVVAGDDFCREHTLLPGDKNCVSGVYGGSGTAAWCVERARDAGREVVWFAKETMARALGSVRNHELADPGTGPKRPRLTMAVHHLLTGLELDERAGKADQPQFQPNPRGRVFGARKEFPSSLAQLVMATGHEDPAARLLHPSLQPLKYVSHPKGPGFFLAR